MVNWRLIKNRPQFWEFIRKVRNDPEIQTGFVEQVNITSEQQVKYMEKHNNDYYICLDVNDDPIGFIGDVDDDIRVAVIKKWQGMGVGKFMVKEFMKLKPNCYAKMKHDNIASKKLFESCGFTYLNKDNNFYYYKLL